MPKDIRILRKRCTKRGSNVLGESRDPRDHILARNGQRRIRGLMKALPIGAGTGQLSKEQIKWIADRAEKAKH